MKRVLAFTFLILISTGLFADEFKPTFTFNLMKRAYFSLIIVDTWSTIGTLENEQIYESNPLWQPIIDNRGLVLALDWSIVIVQNWLFDVLYKKSKILSYIFVGACVIGQGYVVINNLNILR